MISPRAIVRRPRRFELPSVRLPGRIALPGWWRRFSPLHLLWLAVWAPWWVGNELPPPPLPRERDAEMADPPEGTAGAWLLDTLDDLRFRFGLSWTVALLLRGAWLGGVVGIGWLLLGITGVVESPSLRALAILAGAGAALGLVLRVFHRPRYAAVALLLERAFDLRSRLSTAVSGLRYGAASGGDLHPLQLADAANALDRARAQIRPIHWVPIREIFIGFLVALTMLLLLVAQRPEGEIPAASRAGVPQFVPVSERLSAQREQAVPPSLPDPATLQQVEDISRTSNQARKDLETVAGALQTNPTTSPAGDAIGNEDYAGANQQLHDAAPDVTQLPQGEREKLADQMDQAADQVSDQNPDLADATHKAADDVRNGEDTGAIGDLGDQIEQTGQDVIPQQSTNGSLSSAAGQQQPSESGSSGGNTAQAQQPQPGEPGSGQTQAGSQGDPGSGMNASAGTGDAQDGSSTSQGNGGGQGDQQPSGASGDGQGQQADTAQSGGSGEAQQGQSSGDNQSSSGGDASGEQGQDGQSSQGGGAGGGERDTNNQAQDANQGGGGDQSSQDEGSKSGQGEAGNPPPGGTGQTGSDQQATTAGGGASIQLPGTSDQRVRSGSDIGASSVGSGGGVGAAAGDSSGSATGSTGPDPNTVPPEWRSVVEDYFRQGGTP